MTDTNHAKEAERLIALASKESREKAALTLAVAQIRATLALADEIKQQREDLGADLKEINNALAPVEWYFKNHRPNN